MSCVQQPMDEGAQERIGMKTKRHAEVEIALKQDLVLDLEGQVPIRAQLEEGIRRHLARQPVGYRLPSERLLAELFGVSRITVKNALTPLGREGLLRRGIKGSYLARAVNPDAPGGHPLQARLFGRAARRIRLAFAVFESWPAQLAAWEAAACEYNRTQRTVELAIERVPLSVGNDETFARYVTERQPALALVLPQMAVAARAQGLLAPLPTDLVTSLRGPRYASWIARADSAGILAHAAPLNYPVWGALWNQDLLRRHLAVSKPLFRVSDLAEILLEVGPGVPEAAVLVSDAVCLLLCAGYPFRPGGDDWRSRYAGALCSLGARLQPVMPRLRWPSPHDEEGIRDFLEGRSAFYAGNLFAILQRMPQARFPWGGAFLSPPPGYYLPSTWIGIGITAGPFSGPAEEVVRFMVSPAGQEITIRHRLNAACLWTANEDLVRFVKGSSMAQLRRSAQGLWFGEHDYTAQRLGGLLREAGEGRVSRQDALARMTRALSTIKKCP